MRQDKDLQAKRKRTPKASAEKLLTRRELAESRGVHPQTVTQWESRGMPIASRGRKGKPSLYSPAKVEEWIAAREAQHDTGDGGPLDAVVARTRRDEWDAKLKEQQYLTRAKDLLPADAVATQWAAEVAAVRAKLLGVPQSYSDRVHRAAVLSGLAGVEAALVDAVHDVLRQLAAGVHVEAESDEAEGLEA